MSPEKKLIEMERAYWQAIKDQDIDMMLSLTDDPCIVAGAQGVGKIDHKAFAGMMESASWTLRDFEMKDDPIVRMVGDDTAVLAYKVKESLMVDGKPVTFEASDSSTWIRRDGRWLCTLHTEAISGDPFGRDRKAVV